MDREKSVVSESETEIAISSGHQENEVVHQYGQEAEELLPPPIPLQEGAGHSMLIGALNFARKNEASDLHIVVNQRPFVRKQGRILNISPKSITADESKEMLFSILSERQRKILEHDLAIDFCLIDSNKFRYRANITLENNGWTGTFRILKKDPPPVESLNLPASVRRLTDYHQGLVLITGPGCSGKTTTMASLIDSINEKRKEHIITVEDPIEFVYASKNSQITQRALGVNTLSFANALRGALRQDPDIIMVGDLRDLDTISTAITAAETGHLVIASLNTGSAIRTVDRLIDSFPVKQQSQIRVMLADCLRGIVCQQLLPRKDGQGVVLALEVMLNNVSIRKNIMEGKTFLLDNIIQINEKEGMIRMDDYIQQLLDDDVITLEVAKEYARDARKIGVKNGSN